MIPKKLPIEVLNVLSPFMKSKSHLYRIKRVDSTLFYCSDSDSDSSYHFIIHSFTHSDSKLVLEISMMPKSKSSTSQLRTKIYSSDLNDYFQSWVSLLKEYESHQDLFDDPIVKEYQKEFDVFFELDDSDADEVSFEWEKQVWIDDMMSEIQSQTKLLLEENRIDPDLAQVLLEESNELRTQQGNWTKRKVVQKIGGLLSKVRKAGVPFLRDILKSALVKKFVESWPNAKALLSEGMEKLL